MHSPFEESLSGAQSANLTANPYVFDTVAAMVASTDLVVGDRCQTLGYLTIGDSGGNDYTVVAAATGTDDGGSYIDLATHQAQGLFLSGVMSIIQFGAVGDGSTDDTTAINAAFDSSRSRDSSVIAPFRVYFISAPIDMHLASFFGDNKGDWPVFKCGAGFTGTGLVRVGQETAGSSLSDYGVIENLSLNMDAAPNNTKGFYCEHGVNFKTLRNLNAGTAVATTAEAVTANITGYDLRMSDTATQGLYYLTIENLRGSNFFRGFYTEGDSADGLRVSTVNDIRIWNCNQGITLLDADVNRVGTLSVLFHRSDFDTSGTTPTEWDIYMSGEGNVIQNVFLHSDTGSQGSPPLIFTTPSQQFLNIALMSADVETDGHNRVQIITTAGVRQSGGTKETGYNAFFDNQLQLGSLGGPQTQKNLMVNGDFFAFENGSANIANAIDVAYAWKTVKGEATATMGITSASGATAASTYNRSCLIAVANPVANNFYGIRQDLADQFSLPSGLLNTLSNNFGSLTLGIKCRPLSSNASPMRMRVVVSDGVAVSDERYLISYNQATDVATLDEPVYGEDGDWWNLIHHIDLSDAATMLEITVGYFPTDTTDASVYIDSVYLIAGTHTQYGVKPYIETPKIIRPGGIQANTNTPSGATAQAIPIAMVDGSTLWVPAYTSQW